MSIYDYYKKNIPEYYDLMYLDGYTPEQILISAHQTFYEEINREEDDSYNLSISSEFKNK